MHKEIGRRRDDGPLFYYTERLFFSNPIRVMHKISFVMQLASRGVFTQPGFPRFRDNNDDDINQFSSNVYYQMRTHSTDGSLYNLHRACMD